MLLCIQAVGEKVHAILSCSFIKSPDAKSALTLALTELKTELTLLHKATASSPENK